MHDGTGKRLGGYLVDFKLLHILQNPLFEMEFCFIFGVFTVRGDRKKLKKKKKKPTHTKQTNKITKPEFDISNLPPTSANY